MEQRQRIDTNRRAAIEKRRAEKVQEIQSLPVNHVQSDSQEHSDVVRPLLVVHHQTSSHRNKFAFGRISAAQARHHCAIRAKDRSGVSFCDHTHAQVSHGASASSVSVHTDPQSLPVNHVQSDSQEDSDVVSSRLLPQHQTSSHRSIFASGATTAPQARHQCAIRAMDRGGAASASSVSVRTDPDPLLPEPV